MSTDIDTDEIVRQVTDSISAKRPGTDRGAIETVVRQKVEALQKEPVTDFISVLAEREAKAQLDSN